MFKLFDEDGNGNISIDELLNMMAFFIELGMDTGNVDMAKTMAEVFSIGDINRDEKLSKVEFVQVNESKYLDAIEPNFTAMLSGYEATSGHLKVTECEED